ncbi:hypothetical protein ACROAE_09945 [Shewanella sp. MF05960]|uniref:hypothetical protein n=1 Tax=Shewanella sp. MF05960 TaxID=3434874 RepID=UPI003D7B2105
MSKVIWSMRRAGYLLIIIVLVALLPILLQKGLANAYHFKSRFYIDQWQQSAAPTKLQYSNALLAADYAYNIDSQNPHYLLTLAKVMEWGVFADLAQDNTPVFNRLYLDAIEQRPHWPNAYSDYAYNLAFIQHDVDQAWLYLEQALVYGPYTPEVLHQGLAIGFSSWGHLTVEQKQLVFAVARKSVMANWRMRNDLKQLATQYQLTSVICTYLKYSIPSLNAVDEQWVNKDMCR